MASGADKNAPAGEGQTDNIVNEQPIEISSESSNDASGSEQANSDSESDVSIVNSVDESSSDSHEDQKLEDDFAMQLARPGKRYRQFMELCTTAFQLNVFEKIEIAIKEFDKHSVIPPHIWLRYLKALKGVTQTAAERTNFNKKCARALASHYDEPLAEFVVKSLLEEQLVEQHLMWAKVLADYGIERVDFIKDLREALGLLTDQEEIELVEKTMSAQCVTWNCNEEQLDSIEQLIEDFKKKLEDSVENTAWLQELYILKADTLLISKKIKCTLAKFFYERCLAKYPTDSTLWLDYVAYMTKPLEAGGKDEIHTEITDGYLRSNPLPLITRALRTKPSIPINHKFLQLMEHYDLSLERIDEELNRHFGRIEPFKEMSVELHLDYLAYRVRHTNADDPDQVEQLRFAFRDVWDRLSDQYGDTADTSFEVLQLYAQVEYAKLKNPVNGAAIWSEILNYPGSNTKSHLWMAYAQMESEFNGGHRTSTVLRQALMSLSMTADLNAVLELYRRNERCFGTFETIAECQSYCQAYSKDSKSIYHPYRAPCNYHPNRAPWTQQQRAQTPYQRPARREWQPPLKKPTQPVAKKEMPKERDPKKPPPAATVTSNESKESNFKYSSGLETNKIFIKNLYPRCTKEDLTKIFHEFGSILDIRMVQKPNHKLKCIAYIEYESAEAAQKAVISGDGKNIGGLNIEVAISNPPPKVVSSTSTSAAAAGAGSSKSLGAGSMGKAEKRRPQTSLIPTKLLMQGAKRRKKLELDDDSAVSSSSGGDTNGTKSEGETANGKESAADKDKEEAEKKDEEADADKEEDANKETEQPAAADAEAPAAAAPAAPKSNDDFRKLFNM